MVLLGAGASVKSGIPLSGQLAEQAARWAYCRDNGRHRDDPTVLRSDWLPWLNKFPWYQTTMTAADNYSVVIQHLLQPQEDRKAFFLRIIKPGVPASIGYKHLAELMADGVIRTVLTTNFDSVLPDFFSGRTRPHHVEIMKTPADYTKFSTYPPNPQFLYLHGSIEHYTDQNLLDEVQRLNGDMVSHLVPLLRDHPLVVVGYRGAEPSIMRHLLIDQAEQTKNFRHGIFWCARAETISQGLHPLVIELGERIGGNLQIVPIEGFDELFGEIWTAHDAIPAPNRTSDDGRAHQLLDNSLPIDMRPLQDVSVDDLNWETIQSRIPEYCRRMNVAIPARIEREWLLEKLCEFDLAMKRDDELIVTNGGCLLFGNEPHSKIPGAHVLLHYESETENITGNLWKQLDTVMEEFDELNQPFRVKGTVSEDVFPYSRLALKEILVNALVHRTYDNCAPIEITIDSSKLTISNPGGLVEEVLKVFGLPIQEKIERGARGVKGYRNPVIADLFYGAGAMDKRGSGLADVQTWVRDNEGKVRFGPTPDNDAFEVTFYRRVEQVDEITRTATPERTVRYVSNLLEVTQMPETVWRGKTEAKRIKDVWTATGAHSLDPFIIFNGELITFSNLSNAANPLRTQVHDESINNIQLTEFLSDVVNERLLVYLFNQCLQRELEARGLIVDKKRKRAYFPRTKQGGNEVTYQARLRRATRTVAKPYVSRITQHVRYWEHKAIRFRLEHFKDAWILLILPGYVFTLDGYRKLLEGERVGALATRRASHDYNMQVHNDLYFWTWVLAGGQETFALDAGGTQFRLRGTVAEYEVNDTVPPSEVFRKPDGDATADLAEIEEELALIAELSVKATKRMDTSRRRSKSSKTRTNRR